MPSIVELLERLAALEAAVAVRDAREFLRSTPRLIAHATDDSNAHF